MARSTKKPYWVDNNGSKEKKKTKRKASAAVRRAKDVASGKAYKKEFCSWNIADFKFHDPKNPKAKRK